MPRIYETGLSPLIELAKAALPGRRAVTADDLARLLDPTTGAQRRVNVGGLSMQVHPEEWRYLQGPSTMQALRDAGGLGKYSRDDIVDFLRNPVDDNVRRVQGVDWASKGKGHESYTLPGPRTNYRVRGLEGADGLTDSGDYQYHFADAPVHVRLSGRSSGNEIDRELLAHANLGGARRLLNISPEDAQTYLMQQLSGELDPLMEGRSLLERLGAPNDFNFQQIQKALKGRATGPRSTHIDELQSDFYSMPTVPASQRARFEEIEREVAQLRALKGARSQEQEQQLLALLNERLQIPNAEGGRPSGPFEKLWPRLAFNQIANEALTKGDDLVTWSPPWVHDRLYRGKEPAMLDISADNPIAIARGDRPGQLQTNIRENGGYYLDLDKLVGMYRGPSLDTMKKLLANPDLLSKGSVQHINEGRIWTNPDSLMYHNVYGPGGVIEDAARRFARAYGVDPKEALTTTRLEGAGWPELTHTGQSVSGLSRAQLLELARSGPSGTDVPGLRISESMRDIFKRLRDERGAGVPLYASGGPVTLEQLVLRGVQDDED